MLGYAFMGEAHSRALAATRQWMRRRPRLVSLCGRDGDAARGGRAHGSAGRGGADWREQVVDDRVGLFDNAAPNPLHAEPTIAPRGPASTSCARSRSARDATEAQETWRPRRRRASSTWRLQLPLRPGRPGGARARRGRRAGRDRPLPGALPQSWGWDAPPTWRFDARAPAPERSATSARTHRPRPLPGRRDRDACARSCARSSPAARSTTPMSRSSSSRGRDRHARGLPPRARPREPPRREIDGSRGSLAFDLERLNELLIGNERGFRRMLEHGTGAARSHRRLGRTFTYEYLHMLVRSRDAPRRPGRRDLRGRLPLRRGLRRDRAGGRVPSERGGRVPMKTSLGIWAFGSMATRFVPGGYQPQWAGEPTADKVRAGGGGPRRADRRLRVPLPPGALGRQPRRRAGCARRPRHLRLASGLHLDPLFGRGGFSSPDDGVRETAIARSLEGVEFAGELGAHFICRPSRPAGSSGTRFSARRSTTTTTCSSTAGRRTTAARQRTT